MSTTISYGVYSLTFAYSGSTATVTGASQNSPIFNSDVVIPSSITVGGVTYTVNTINNYAFNNNLICNSVTVPSSVTLFKNNSFYNFNLKTLTILGTGPITIIDGLCYWSDYLKNVTMPGNFIGGGNMFRDCGKLETVTFTTPITSTSSPGSMFRGCSHLQSFTIPSQWTYLNLDFYNDASLSTITIPSLVTKIDYRTFYGCSSLNSVYVLTPSCELVDAFPSRGAGNSLKSTCIAYCVNSDMQTKFQITNAFSNVVLLTGLPSITTVTKNNSYASTINIVGSNLGGTQGITINGNIASTSFTVIDSSNVQATFSTFNNAIITSCYLNANLTVNGNTVAVTSNTLSPLSVTIGIPPVNVCFPAKTPVLTDSGYVHIDKLDPTVHTIQGKKIVGVTETTHKDSQLVSFDPHALGTNMPSRKTVISPNHKVMWNGQMIKAKDLVQKFQGIDMVPYKGESLYNVLLEEHGKMVVNNLVCETLDPENGVARLYRLLQTLTPEEQQKVLDHVGQQVHRKRAIL